MGEYFRMGSNSKPLNVAIEANENTQFQYIRIVWWETKEKVKKEEKSKKRNLKEAINTFIFVMLYVYVSGSKDWRGKDNPSFMEGQRKSHFVAWSSLSRVIASNWDLVRSLVRGLKYSIDTSIYTQLWTFSRNCD